MCQKQKKEKIEGATGLDRTREHLEKWHQMINNVNTFLNLGRKKTMCEIVAYVSMQNQQTMVSN